MSRYVDADKAKNGVMEFVDEYGEIVGMFVNDFNILLERCAADIPRWIPVTEKLPETIEPVNITWVNRKPSRYYEHIKDKPFVATGHYCNGRWYWFSAVCQDYLNEYGDCEMDRIDSAVEVIAWMELPEPYKTDSNTTQHTECRVKLYKETKLRFVLDEYIKDEELIETILKAMDEVEE